MFMDWEERRKPQKRQLADKKVLRRPLVFPVILMILMIDRA